MAAKPVLREGVRWCVGDGKSIKIWEDAWIPSTESGRIISPRPATDIGGEGGQHDSTWQSRVECWLGKKHFPPYRSRDHTKHSY